MEVEILRERVFSLLLGAEKLRGEREGKGMIIRQLSAASLGL